MLDISMPSHETLPEGWAFWGFLGVLGTERRQDGFRVETLGLTALGLLQNVGLRGGNLNLNHLMLHFFPVFPLL